MEVYSAPGSVGGGQSPVQLSEEGQQAEAFARSKIPGLGPLASFTTQVVAGTNFGFTFEGHQEVITVWSKPWENGFLEVTLPNGDKVNNQ
jgi:hypothetical protein